MRTVLKNIQEYLPPSTPVYEGSEVDGLRWIRQVSETLNNEQLKVRSALTTELSPGATELIIADVGRFPNSGSIVVSYDSLDEETLTFTSRDTVNNKLLGLSSPTNTHSVGQFVYSDEDLMGTFEVELSNYPIRYNSPNVVINGVKELRENVDFEVVNTYSGGLCQRGFLRFFQGSQPKRFSRDDSLEITYHYVVEDITQVNVHTQPGNIGLVDIFEDRLYERKIDDLLTQDAIESGNIKITPSMRTTTSTISFPIPATIKIPDTENPQDIVLVDPISQASPPTELTLSNIEGLPISGAFSDLSDDEENRSIVIGGVDTVQYSDVDIANNKIVGITGTFTQDYAVGEDVLLADGPRLFRDIVKNEINKSVVAGQVEALSVDVGSDRYLRIRAKLSDTSFNLQPGTYNISYLGFDDDLQVGLHTDVTSVLPFSGNKMTFRDFSLMVQRREIARELLGQTLSVKIP